MSPHYAHGDDRDPEPDGHGPDDTDGPRSIDGEQERLQRFLHEMDRQFEVDKLPRVEGSATVDFYDKLGSSPPYLSPKETEVVHQMLPLLQQGDYRIVLVVWATMPSDSAWTCAADQARLIVDDIVRSAHLSADARCASWPLDSRGAIPALNGQSCRW